MSLGQLYPATESEAAKHLITLAAGRAVGIDRTNEVRQAYGLQPLPTAEQNATYYQALAGFGLLRIGPASLPSLKATLRAGLAIRRRAWEPGRHLTLGPQQRPQRPYRTSCDLPAPHGAGEWLQLHCHTGALSYYTPSQEDALAEDWQIMTETTY